MDLASRQQSSTLKRPDAAVDITHLTSDAPLLCRTKGFTPIFLENIKDFPEAIAIGIGEMPVSRVCTVMASCITLWQASKGSAGVRGPLGWIVQSLESLNAPVDLRVPKLL